MSRTLFVAFGGMRREMGSVPGCRLSIADTAPAGAHGGYGGTSSAEVHLAFPTLDMHNHLPSGRRPDAPQAAIYGDGTLLAAIAGHKSSFEPDLRVFATSAYAAQHAP